MAFFHYLPFILQAITYLLGEVISYESLMLYQVSLLASYFPFLQSSLLAATHLLLWLIDWLLEPGVLSRRRSLTDCFFFKFLAIFLISYHTSLLEFTSYVNLCVFPLFGDLPTRHFLDDTVFFFVFFFFLLR